MKASAGMVSVLAHGLVVAGLGLRARPPEPTAPEPIDARPIELIELEPPEPAPPEPPEPAPPEPASPEPEPEPEPEPPEPAPPEPAPPEPEPSAPSPAPDPAPSPAPDPIPGAPGGGPVAHPGSKGAPGAEGPADAPPTGPRKLGRRYSNATPKSKPARGCQERPSKPVPTHRTSPNFPAAVLRSGLSGTLVLRASIDRLGGVTKVAVVKSPDPAVEGPAKDAFGAWRFEPAVACGKPVPSSYAKAWKFGGG